MTGNDNVPTTKLMQSSAERFSVRCQELGRAIFGAEYEVTKKRLDSAWKQQYIAGKSLLVAELISAICQSDQLGCGDGELCETALRLNAETVLTR